MPTLTPGQSGLVADVLRAEPIAQPACFLSDHAYCCEFADGAILLDLRDDTYLGIDARHLPDLRSRIENWPDLDAEHRKAESHDIAASEKLIADLLARGILTTSYTPLRPRPAAIP